METGNSIAIFISNMLTDGSASLKSLLQKVPESFGDFFVTFPFNKVKNTF